MLLLGSECILDNGNWLLESISTTVTEHVQEPETSSQLKKKKHRHGVENENGLLNAIELHDDVILLRCQLKLVYSDNV